MVTQKFGWTARKHVEKMASHKLRRKVLEASDALSEEPRSHRVARAAGR
jgi:hypothetical protein